VEAGSDAMLRAIVQSSVNPFVVLDPTGTVTWASDGVHSLLGTSPADHIGRHFLDIIAPSSHEAAIAEYSEFTNREHDRSWIGPPMLLELVHGDGGTITCEVSASTGTPHGIDGIIVQIRRWRGAVLLFAAVDALAAGAPLDAVLADIAAVAEHEMPGSALFVVTGPTGDRPQIVAAPPVTARSHPDLAQQVLAHLGSVDEPDVGGLDRLAAGAGFQACWAVPVTVRGDDGPNAQLVVMRSVVGPLGPNHTSVHRTVRLLALAIEAERNRLAWRRSAVTDPLTELANRSGLEEWLADRAERRPDDPIALLFCDVDEFKPVNDRLGHGAGDRVLRVVASRLRAAVRDDDLVCRWGGDEFLVVCTDPSAAEDLAARLIERIEEPVALDEGTAHVGLSVGIGFGTCASPLDELLRSSDHALLEAKDAGRRRYVVSG
jgi:diguanylate cyclase (GGDEF)-like protein/PAS domain S-box-containing protein